MQAGDDEQAKAAISDRFLDDLIAIGSADEVRAGVERYAAAGATSPCIGPVPRTDFEATLEAAKPP
jgi:alkanesulfonate monooxygenase SsuD/methylene tetrahydromethanopterin reductase-like flavin-dependent oxidoreductase (luciferase family)